MSAGEQAVATPRLTGRAWVLATIVILLALASVSVLRQVVEQRAEINRLEQRVSALLEERTSLERRMTQLRDPEYLERLARECLGMVAPGEIAFVVPGGAPPQDC